jgi:CBS domain-containing protein
MSLCPYCGAENIDGADECERCNQSLGHLTKPKRAPGVEDAMFRDRVGCLVHAPPVVVDENATVDEVLKLLVQERIGCVLVTRGGEVAGIFSERDALLKIGEQIEECRQRPIREFMTESPETLDVEAKLAFAVHKMDIGHFRHVPVLKEGRLHGVASARGVLRYLTDRVREKSS